MSIAVSKTKLVKDGKEWVAKAYVGKQVVAEGRGDTIAEAEKALNGELR